MPVMFKYKDNRQLLWSLGQKIPGLPKTFYYNFQDFPGPNPFFRTFQGLEILQNEIQDFPGVWEPCYLYKVELVFEIITSVFVHGCII